MGEREGRDAAWSQCASLKFPRRGMKVSRTGHSKWGTSEDEDRKR